MRVDAILILVTKVGLRHCLMCPGEQKENDRALHRRRAPPELRRHPRREGKPEQDEDPRRREDSAVCVSAEARPVVGVTGVEACGHEERRGRGEERGTRNATEDENRGDEHREDGEAPDEVVGVGGALEREHELEGGRREEVCDDHPRNPSHRAEHTRYIASLL